MAILSSTSLSLFGPLQAGGGQPRAPIPTLNTQLIGLALEAQVLVRTASTFTDPLAGLDAGPDVTPPWQIAEEPRTLASRINEARALDTFIDLTDPDVQRAGDDVDAQATFALFQGLTSLQTLAQYAAEKNTPTASLKRLDEQFQKGLQQIRDYVASTELDKLSLLIGDKASRVTTPVGLGRDRSTFIGPVVQTGLADDPLAGVAGDEVFTVSITKSGEVTDFTIDLAELTGPASLKGITDLINAKIEAIPKLDELGDPVLDENGDPVSKFVTRFGFELNDDFDFSIKIEGSSTETVKLTPITAEPTLFVAGGHRRIDNDDPATGLLTSFTGLSSDFAQDARRQVTGIDRPATDIAQTADEDADPVAAATTTSGVVADSEGFLYVVGSSTGSFDGQINAAAEQDVYLTKMDPAGNVVFSRLLGVGGSAEAFAITIDGDDNVIVAGQTDDVVASGDERAGLDSFVAKYSSRGDEVFRYQLDTVDADGAVSVSVDAAGDVFVGGFTQGAIHPAETHGGGKDGFVLKLDGTTGALADRLQFGGTGSEEARATAIAADGNLLVAAVENGQAVLRKLDAGDLSNTLFEVSLGALAGGSIEGLAVDGAAVYVAGMTGNGSLDGGTASIVGGPSGGLDGFVMRIDDAGGSAAATRTTYLGTAETDRVTALTVNAGTVYLAGTTTGALEGTRSGPTDAFVARIDGATGAVGDVEQFGLLLRRSEAAGIAFANTGTSVLNALGLPTGTVGQAQTRDITTQTSVRDGDHFFISINGGKAKKITVEAGDTFTDIRRRIALVSLGDVKASVTRGTDGIGDTLKIEAGRDDRIDIIAGEDGRDALARLGLEPARLLPASELFGLDDDEDSDDEDEDKEDEVVDGLGGAFGLGLDGALNIRDKKTAEFVLTQIDDAILTVQRAFRSLTPNLFELSLREQARFDGPVPARLQKQLNGYQDALLRLQLSSFSTGPNLTI